MNVQSITLDLSKRQIPAQIVRIGQGDNEGTTIQAKILDNGVSTNLAGMTATMEMRLPDGSAYASGGRCTVSGSVVTCVVDEEYFAAVAGYTDEAYFKLTSGSTVYSTSRFRVKVERAASDGATPVVPWEDAAAELIARVNQQVNTAVSSANTATGNANAAANSANAAAMNANATANGVESRVQQIAQNAAQQATADAEDRIDAAIDAMGDISELAVPLMTPDIRGGAKLEESGGLALRDGALGIGSLVQESDGYARGGLAEVTAKGHAEQVSTTGKNLLPNNMTSQTKNGVTFTVNADKSITVNGTATATTTLGIKGSNLSVDAGTYTLSGCPENGSSNTYYLGWNRNANDLGSGISITNPNAGDVYIFIASGYTCNNLTFYPQLELGSTTTDYEPYSGGLPSPRPDWEQPIEVVRGRNLWQFNRNSYVDGNGTISDSGTNALSKPIQVKAGESYVVDCYENMMAIGFALFSGSTMTKRQSTNNVTYSVCDIPSDGQLYIWVNKNGLSIGDASQYKVQLTLGSTPHPYVPYGYVGMEVQGKNLLDVSNAEIGTTWNGVSNSARARIIVPVDKGQTYTISVVDSSSFDTIYANTTDSVPASESGSYVIPSNTFVATGAYLVIGFNKSNITKADIENCHIQLELGSTATEYQPYFVPTTTPIPLPERGWVGSLPDGTADTLTLDGAGKVEWTLPTSEVAYDGSNDEQWIQMGSSGHGFRCVNNSIHVSSSSLVLANAYCDRYIRRNFSQVYTAAVDGFGIADSAQWLAVSESSVASLDDFKTWLSTHPITILYPLVTPVTEDCGYVDMPAIPSDATVTIPELDALGIKYFVDDTVTEYGREVIARGQHDISETNGEIDTLEASIAPVESVVATSNHAVGDYFMLGNVLMRTTTAIATGERITTSNAMPATIQGQIDTLRDAVDLQVTSSYVTVNAGGVTRFGQTGGRNLYVVNIRCTATNDIPMNTQFMNLPFNINGLAYVVAATDLASPMSIDAFNSVVRVLGGNITSGTMFRFSFVVIAP